MNLRPLTCFGFAVLMAATAMPAIPATPALAQTQLETNTALARLAETLGALSHLETVCQRGVSSRTDMEALLTSEELSGTRKAVLIDAFNRGFRGVANTHQRCTSASERLIELHYERGATIVTSLLDE